MGSRLETALTTSLVVAAVATAAGPVHREFIGPAKSRRANTIEYMSNWRDLLPAGRRIGDSTAPVTVVEFADLQCPYCRRFNQALHSTFQKYPNKVSVVFIHFPLPGHKYALGASRAVECANVQHKFAELVDLIYERQDSLEGRDSVESEIWTNYAYGVGVADTAAFTRCMQDPTTPSAVEAGVRLAKTNSVKATPTVIINGWRFSNPPSDSDLVRRVGDFLAGKNPRSFLSRILGF